jgi:hypothetical protein
MPRERARKLQKATIISPLRGRGQRRESSLPIDHHPPSIGVQTSVGP